MYEEEINQKKKENQQQQHQPSNKYIYQTRLLCIHFEMQEK